MVEESSRFASPAQRARGLAAVLAIAALGAGAAACSDEETQEAIDQAEQGLSTAEEQIEEGLEEAEKQVPQAKKQIEKAGKEADQGIDEAKKQLNE